MKKIIVLVLACDVGGYDKMVSACRKTWASESNDNVKVYYIYGHRDGYVKNGTYATEDEIYSDTPERLDSNIFEKTVNAFEYLLANEEFDYIFRCNAGSYVKLDILEKSTSNLKLNDVYRAVKGTFGNINFGSGSGFLISKNLVKSIVENRNNMPHIIMDDVTIGNYITNILNINLMEQSRVDCQNENELLQKFNINEFHYYFCHTINPNLIYKTHEKFNEK